MRVKPVVRDRELDVYELNFYLKEHEDGAVFLMADDPDGFRWSVLSIEPGEEGLIFKRSTDLPDEFFTTDDLDRIFEAEA